MDQALCAQTLGSTHRYRRPTGGRSNRWSDRLLPQSDLHPVDAFIRAKLAQHTPSLAREADRRVLIRRLTFDLHGLPPTPEDVDAFVSDRDRQAYEALAEWLLASP